MPLWLAHFEQSKINVLPIYFIALVSVVPLDAVMHSMQCIEHINQFLDTELYSPWERITSKNCKLRVNTRNLWYLAFVGMLLCHCNQTKWYCAKSFVCVIMFHRTYFYFYFSCKINKMLCDCDMACCVWVSVSVDACSDVYANIFLFLWKSSFFPPFSRRSQYDRYKVKLNNSYRMTIAISTPLCFMYSSIDKLFHCKLTISDSILTFFSSKKICNAFNDLI